jgi:nuclear pore complex protein Nup98-Nup96
MLGHLKINFTDICSTGGFGQSTGTTSLFGPSKPAFGATTSSGTSLFGNTATAGSSGFGGSSSTFGGTTANNSTFGGSNPVGGFSFGQPKPAFGSGGGTGLFGSTGSTAGGSGFGTSQSNPFGQAGAGTALGQGVPPSEGTNITPFNATNEKDPTGNGTNSFQSINFMPAYSKYSFEVSPLANPLSEN